MNVLRWLAAASVTLVLASPAVAASSLPRTLTYDPATVRVTRDGGLSRIDRLYADVPRLWGRWIFSDAVATRIVPARFGAASGVRGAARLC